MKRDTALAAAIASSVGYAVLVGVTSSRSASSTESRNPLVSVVVSFRDSGRLKRVTEQRQLTSIEQWLDDAFENPKTAFDVRDLPATDNLLVLNFESGDSSTIRFSIGDRGRKSGAARTTVLLEFKEQAYTIDRIPRTFLVDGDGGDAPEEFADALLKHDRRHSTQD